MNYSSKQNAVAGAFSLLNGDWPEELAKEALIAEYVSALRHRPAFAHDRWVSINRASSGGGPDAEGADHCNFARFAPFNVRSARIIAPLLLALARQYNERRAERPPTACSGQEPRPQAFFYRDRFTDFELRFVPAACDSSMWCLFQLSHCAAPDAARTGAVETLVSSSLHERGMTRKSEPPRSVYVITGTCPLQG